MCNQMVTSEKGSGNYKDLDKTRVKLFPNFICRRITLAIMLILDRIDRELLRLLHSLKRLELKFGLSSEFFDKIPVRILLDVLFRVFRFSKVSIFLCPGIFSHDILNLRRHLDTETYRRLPCEITNYIAEISRKS